MTVNVMANLLFELLQLSVGTRQKLSFVPSAEEWTEAFGDAMKQALVGVCFYGLQRAGRHDAGQTAHLPPKLKMRWLAFTADIQRRNEVMNRRCAELHDMIALADCRSCVLKGQAVAVRYDVADDIDGMAYMSMLRQSGDIDVWMLSDADSCIRWARATGSMYYYDYHHADLRLFPNVDVELHYRPSISRNLWRNARLQRWFRGEGRRHVVYDERMKFCVPDDMFSLMLTLNHNLWHLLYEGVGLRQMMDLYFVAHTMRRTDEVSRLLRHFRLEAFAAASAWVLWHLFDGGADGSLFVSCRSPLPPPDERSGRFLLDEIMKAGNFGFYDKRLKAGRYASRMGLMVQWMRHTMRLVRHFPVEVAWTPVGIVYISLWRRWRWLMDGVDKVL